MRGDTKGEMGREGEGEGVGVEEGGRGDGSSGSSKGDRWSSTLVFSYIGVSKLNDSPCRIWITACNSPMVQIFIQEGHTECYTSREACLNWSLVSQLSIRVARDISLEHAELQLVLSRPKSSSIS